MVAKKSAAGKVAAKKTAAGTRRTAGGSEGEQPVAEKAAAKKSAAKKSAAKKAAAEKSAAEKTAAKKTAAKKTADGNAAEKAPAKKAAAKKSTAKKAPAAKKAAGGEAGAAGMSAPAKKRAAGKTATTTGATTVVAKKTADTDLAGDGQAADTSAGAVPKARGTQADPASLPVRPGEDPWTADELAEAREELSAETLRLRSELEASEESLVGLLRDSQDGAGEDEADTGSKNITREHELGIAAHAREVLEQTEHALERIEAGTYGVCENCGNAIGKARMQAFPRATLCVECKQKQERRY